MPQSDIYHQTCTTCVINLDKGMFDTFGNNNRFTGLHYDLYWFNDFHFIGDLTRLYAYVEVENLLPVLNNKLRLANHW